MEGFDEVLRIGVLIVVTIFAVLGSILQRRKEGRAGQGPPLTPVPEEASEEWIEAVPEEPVPAEAPQPPKPPPQFKLVPKESAPGSPSRGPTVEDRVFRNRRLTPAARLMLAAEILLPPKSLRRPS